MASVVVVGGGPAGCAFAITAARGGHEVVLLHEDRRGKAWAGEALPAGGGELVTSVFGVDVMDGHHIAYGTTAAWGSSDLVAHDFMGHWSGHGWHLERARFDAELRARAQQAGVRVVAERLTSLHRTSESWLINDHLKCELIVDASGRVGAVVGRLGVRAHRLDNQIALVATLADSGGARVTTIETGPNGWWYSAGLPSGKRVVALITDADLVTSDRAETFNRSLAETIHIKEFIPAYQRLSVAVHPAGSVQRDQVCGDGWIAVGDAAVSFDPLSSQGLITGIVMAAHGGRLIDSDLTDWEFSYHNVMEEHEGIRASIYAVERRWPETPFWSRRNPGHSGHPARPV